MIKELKNLGKFDPNRDAHSNWKSADGLHVAWLLYRPFELQERYRDSGRNPHLSKALKFEMQLEVREKIAAGEFLAFGVRVLPDLRDKAEQIPEVLFQSNELKIDWEQDQISGLGRQFNDVRICLWADSNSHLNEPIVVTSPVKRGRKSHFDLFEQAFVQLQLEHENFSDWTFEKQMHEIQAKAVILHPGRFKSSPPGRSTIYRFLRERQNKGSIL